MSTAIHSPSGTSARRSRLDALLSVGCVISVLCVCGVQATRATAQGAGPDASVRDAAALADAGAPDAEALHPPELLERVEAEFPVSARDAGLEGVVGLRLTIEVDGRVSEAEVVEPAGHGFDEAARAAALRFVFAPARRGDTPMTSRILYRYEFRLPVRPVEPAPAPPAPPERQPSAAAPPAVLVVPPPKATIDVTVAGSAPADPRLRSAEAVKVVDTEQAQRRSADMAEVLARIQGVGVRRSGGLGSSYRVSLNGLTDQQIRMLLDGVPLELAGYPFGIANVPVNLIERVEIYSGVLPIRFGADALGGAIQLVTDTRLEGTHGAASYELGSYDTHRVTASGHHVDGGSGFFTRVTGFFDYTRNDYPIDVEVADASGQPRPARVHRFHDGYRAAGGNVELGFLRQPWAKRLSLRMFLTDYDKEYQHNPSMTVPYGEVSYGATGGGANFRYQQDFSEDVRLDAVGGYAYTRGHYLDVSECHYDWFGRCVRERSTPGETDGDPHDQLVWDHAAFARLNFSWRPSPEHALRLAIAPNYSTRTGDERRPFNPTDRDPMSAERSLLSFLLGVEYELDVLDARLENILFAKQYLQRLDSEEVRAGNVFTERDRTTVRAGVGNALRYRVLPWLSAKASYEFATRLPSAEEIFGDNVFVVANLQLRPETSHNVNLGISAEAPDTALGEFRGSITGYLREAQNLIVLLGTDRLQSYRNVYGARSLGVEAAAGWTSPGEYFVLDGNLTAQSFRNTASRGTFGDYEGDSIPNRPNFFANGEARVQLGDVATPGDRASLSWTTRYVHEFYRSWESLGLREWKQVIPSQLVHSIGLGYVVRSQAATITTSVELQNVGDVVTYDYFGVQRPRRAFYAKATAEF